MFCNFANLCSTADNRGAEPVVEEYGFTLAFHCGRGYIHRGAPYGMGIGGAGQCRQARMQLRLNGVHELQRCWIRTITVDLQVRMQHLACACEVHSNMI